jgi:hypothetical protein
MNHPVKQLSIRHIIISLVAAAVCLASLPIAAKDSQDLSAIHEAIINFITAQHEQDADLQVSPSTIDSRLRLVPCKAPLRAF